MTTCTTKGYSAGPITDNWGTCGHLTQFINQPQQKQTEQLLALIHTHGLLVDWCGYWMVTKDQSWNRVLLRPFWQIWSHMWLTQQKCPTYTLPIISRNTTFHWEKLAAVWIKPHLFTISIPTKALTFIYICRNLKNPFSWLLSSFFSGGQ